MAIDQSPVVHPSSWSQPAGYAAPRPEPPRRRRWVVPAATAVAAVTFAAGGGAVAAALSADHPPRATAAQLGTPSGAPDGFPGFFGGGRSRGGGGTQQAPSQSGGGTVPSAITGAVDPTIVDINTTLGLRQAAAAGTGIVLTPSGEILTNNHVIDGATAITATDVGTGRTYQATVVGYDRTHDLAVLQLQGAAGLPTATLGDSSTVSAGASIYAIGNAGGTGGTPAAVTGSVVAVDQSITASDQDGGNAEQLTGLIQVAAAIQPGDSGGPLVDSFGRIIGVDTAADNSGNGFAIPINTATAIAAQIKAGHASATSHIGVTAFLGIAVSSTTGPAGVTVADVVPGSPAQQVGLVPGDTLLALDGTPLSTPTTLTTLLNAHHPGDSVTLTVADSTGQTGTVTLTLVAGPAA